MLLVLKSILYWLVLTWATVNLYGLFMRAAFWRAPAMESPTDRVAAVIAEEVRGYRKASFVLAAIWAAGLVAFFWALNHFWNHWMALAAVVVMVGRTPDLLWEIRNGRRATPSDAPKSALYAMGFVFILAALPVVWYSLKAAPHIAQGSA